MSAALHNGTIVWGIEEVMKCRDLFTEPPSEGWSLEDICKRRSIMRNRSRGALPKGENAWEPSQAEDFDEHIRKVVQGALNKLTPEKYRDIFAGLKINDLLEVGAMHIAVPLIFKKALSEPNYSELYAKLCHDIAKFEVQVLKERNLDPTLKVTSKFRDIIITQAQAEFEKGYDVTVLPGESEEEASMRMRRRKKANIKFVGQLFMKNILSERVIHEIINRVLHGTHSQAEFIPEEIDIEVVSELIETVGRKIDSSENGRPLLDTHFERIKELSKGKAYPPRIRFKLLDIIDLRRESWVARVERTGVQTPQTLQDLAEAQRNKELKMQAKMRTPTTRRGQAGSFPNSPISPNTPTSSRGEQVSRSNTPGSSRGTSPCPEMKKPDKSLKARSLELLKEWSYDKVPLGRNWSQAYRSYGLDEDSLRTQIVKFILLNVCLVSHKEAHDDAAKFINEGIDVGKQELLNAFAAAVAQAVDEGFAVDSPKFFERLVKMLVSSAQNEVDVYRDAISVIFAALDEVEGDEGCDVVEDLLSLWQLLPPTSVPVNVLDVMVKVRFGEGSKTALTVEEMIVHVVKKELVAKEDAKKWLENLAIPSCPSLVSNLKKRLPL